ncbi:AcrR family transcriptional regulator [Arthrobacter pascens]|uniref:TetR/AcrR family transcriptional regulator n=1 Tax=Arthrobacter pascens TaxID=1677 RepID=UPI002782D310|nr:TetR/AcrR family transcriptional regulator [Arthrobacter pascens]MDQ0636263.1 AcrR family transcriptional regulator [Arthrobacter pascens]
MTFIPLEPGSPPGPSPERRDAARNRERLLGAARELIEQCGADALTMDRLAEAAGVGKGTVFRRFGSRAGLMMTLLSDAEADFQARFMFGPPPLGPGAPGLDRLVAFGAARIAFVLEYGELARAADVSARNRFEVPAVVLWHRHIEFLLREEGMDSDPWLMAMFLGAALEPDRLLHTVRVRTVSPDRLAESWRELVTRVVRGG